MRSGPSDLLQAKAGYMRKMRKRFVQSKIHLQAWREQKKGGHHAKMKHPEIAPKSHVSIKTDLKALSKAFLHLPARFMVGIPQLFAVQKSHQFHDPKIPKWPLGKAPVNLDVVRGWRHLSSRTTIDNDSKKGRHHLGAL